MEDNPQAPQQQPVQNRQQQSGNPWPQESQEWYQYLLQLSDALRAVDDPIAIEEIATRLAMQSLDADRCYYCQVVDGQAIISRDARRGHLPSVAGTYPLSSFPLLKKVVEEGRPFIVEDAHTTAFLDEELRAICLQMHVIAFLNIPVSKQGKPIGVLCLVQSAPRRWTELEIQLQIETAERTWAAVERARAEEALRLADHRKDEFLAMLAHELRNPMSTIRSGLQILSLTKGEDELTGSTVEMMNRQTDHLVRMVDDLLDVSRISQGKIELKKERVNLVDLVSQAAESVRSQYQEQGKRLQIDLPQAPIYLEGDATRLTQVVANLLTNGARYTGEQGQVWLRLTHQNNKAVLRVIDNGIGLRANQLDTIFELFVQVDNSAARTKGGLGLGLTLVKRLVELHGGQVEAHSDGLGQGSTFTVGLPTLVTAADPQAQPVPPVADPSAAKRILVIDDNADAGFTLAMLLKLKGYDVHSQTSGRGGLDAAEALQPSAILLDIGMPVMDGYETCRLVRQQVWGQAMVIIALTGYGQADDRQRTQEAGFDGHLVKPVDLVSLTNLLADLLGKGRR